MPAEYQHIPIDEYKSNLSKLISVLRSPESAYHCPDTKIIMITPPPIMEKAHFEDTKASRKADGTLVEPMSPTRRYEHSKQYSVACYDFAKEESLPVVDIHTAIIRAAGGETEEQLKPYFL